MKHLVFRRRKAVQLLTCMGISTLAASAVHAATYSVSPNGNDAAAGSATAPWLTLQKAANTVKAGDTVVVEDGTYAGFRMRTSGSGAQRITFKARNKNAAKINTPDPNNDVDLITVLSASYVTVDGFEVFNAPRAGIGVRSMGDDTGADTRDDIVQNCYCHDNGLPSGGAHDGIFTGFALNFIAQDNVCSGNGEHGIYISNSADNPIARRNVCSNNRGCGIQINADLDTGDGTQDGLVSNWLIENNVIFGNGTSGGAGINLDGAINGICRNNLLYNNLATGIALFGINGAQASNGNAIVNNTVYQPTSSRAALLIADGANNNLAFNNILYSNTNKPGIEVDAATGFAHDFNVVSSVSGGTLAAHESSPAATSLFVNSAGNDYHLQANSPALDAGTASFGGRSAPPQDIENTSRPQGAAFDLGAYEKAGTAPTPTPTPTTPPSGTLQFSAVSYTVGESGPSALITVTRTNGSGGAASVHYATSNGTATAGADYTSVAGTLTWDAGDASAKTFAVQITQDALVEGPETVALALSAPTGATLGATKNATLTIADDDNAPRTLFYGIAAYTDTLYTFGSDAPGTVLSTIAITGLASGESLRAIDCAPNGVLYAVSSASRVYVLNPTTGVATPLGAPFRPTLTGDQVDVEFNPVTGLLRVVNNAAQNLRIGSQTGATRYVDPNLAYAANDKYKGIVPTVTGAAYTHNVSGATTTTLYGIDSALDTLVRIGSLNGTPTPSSAGIVTTLGSLGVNTTELTGLDIAPSSEVAYALLTTASSTSGLYRVNLNTGAATFIGGIGKGLFLRDLAVVNVK